jgi:hypothetical protein
VPHLTGALLHQICRCTQSCAMWQRQQAATWRCGFGQSQSNNRGRSVHCAAQHLHSTCSNAVVVLSLQEMYKKIAWPLYRIYGHAFDAMKTMVADDGAGIFKRLEEDNGGPIEVLTPEVGACCCGQGARSQQSRHQHRHQSPSTGRHPAAEQQPKC